MKTLEDYLNLVLSGDFSIKDYHKESKQICIINKKNNISFSSWKKSHNFYNNDGELIESFFEMEHQELIDYLNNSFDFRFQIALKDGLQNKLFYKENKTELGKFLRLYEKREDSYFFIDENGFPVISFFYEINSLESQEYKLILEGDFLVIYQGLKEVYNIKLNYIKPFEWSQVLFNDFKYYMNYHLKQFNNLLNTL